MDKSILLSACSTQLDSFESILEALSEVVDEALVRQQAQYAIDSISQFVDFLYQVKDK